MFMFYTVLLSSSKNMSVGTLKLGFILKVETYDASTYV